MGREGDRPLSGTMADGSQGLAAADDSGSHTPGAGAGAVVRILLLAQGWTAAATAEALARDPHGPAHHRTLGVSLRRRRTCGPDIRADRWFPPALDQAQQEKLKEAVEQPPATSGIGLANWYWKVVRRFALERFALERFGIELSRSSCLNYLHRLGFAFKRPKKRLLKADAAKREAFVAAYAALREEAQQTRARIFFADEAHFRADAELRGKWVLKGRPALVDSTSPRYGEKASYYSAVCLETGEVEWMELEGNSNSGTSVDFLKQLRGKHPGPLRVIWAQNTPLEPTRLLIIVVDDGYLIGPLGY